MSIISAPTLGNISFATSAPSFKEPRTANVDGDGFSAMLKTLAEGTVNSIQNGESTAIAAIQGKTTIQSAVMATMQAEQSLQAALAVRDKVVSAFLEISRMQI